MKDAGILRGGVHAQAQLRGKAGGLYLRGAVGQCIHHVMLPAQCVCNLVGGQQLCQLLDLAVADGGHPLRVKTPVRRQQKQLGCILGFRRARQHFSPKPFCQFADKRGARRKTQVGEQRGHVDGLHQHGPPGF